MKADAFIVFRVGLREHAGDPLQVGSRRVRRHAARQASNHGEFPTAAIGVGTVTERHVELIINPRLSPRENAHHRIWAIVQS